MRAENAGPAALALPLLWLPRTAEATSGGRTGEVLPHRGQKGPGVIWSLTFMCFCFVLLLLLLFKSYSPIPFSGLKTTVAPCGLRAEPKSMHAIQPNFQACHILPLQKCIFLLPQRPHGQAALFITRLCSLPLVSPSQHAPVARVKAFVGHSALPRSFLLSSRQSSRFMQSSVIAHVVDYPSLSLFFPKTMAPWRTRL